MERESKAFMYVRQRNWPQSGESGPNCHMGVHTVVVWPVGHYCRLTWGQFSARRGCALLSLIRQLKAAYKWPSLGPLPAS